MFWWNEAVEVNEATEVVKAVQVIEAAEIVRFFKSALLSGFEKKSFL